MGLGCVTMYRRRKASLSRYAFSSRRGEKPRLSLRPSVTS